MPPFQEEEKSQATGERASPSKKMNNADMLKHELLMDALDLNSDAGSNKLNPSFLLPIPESDTASNLLDNNLDQDNFVQAQI